MTFKKIISTFAIGLAVLIPASGQLQHGAHEPGDSVKHEGVDGSKVVSTAMQYIGARYRHGHAGPTAFDCSGFTSYVYRQKNITLSRSSRVQYGQGTPVKSIADLKPGIVKEVNPEKGDFSFVHASRTGVKVDVLSSAYYKKRYIGARRVL